MNIRKILSLLLLLLLAPTLALSGGMVGGSNPGITLQLTSIEVVELSTILAVQDAAYIETENGAVVQITEENNQLEGIDIDTLESVKIELSE